jgi:murein L,D-transpeptidase YcbB/YkuD
VSKQPPLKGIGFYFPSVILHNEAMENSGEGRKDMNLRIKEFFDDPANRKKVLFGAGAGLALLCLIVLANIFGGQSHPKELFIDTVASPLATRLDKIDFDAPYYTKRIRYKTIRFYQRSQGKTKWLEYKKPNLNYTAFVKAVADAAQYGLNPDHYDIKDIDEDLEKLYDNKERTPDDVAQMDIRITSAFFLFTTHLIEGRIRQAGYGDFVWKKNIPKENDIQLLIENTSGNLYEILDELHPSHEQYEKLRRHLIEYRKLESKTNLIRPAALAKGSIKPGEKNARIPLIRRKLELTDIKEYTPDDSLVYDERLEEGVRKFQKRHGLVVDGVISSATMRYLNQSFREKADLIELNLERIRWLPREYGENYISVNVPEYMLRVYEKGKNVLEMRVVLGSEFNATPIFNDTLEHIVFSPTWNVPESIFQEEMMPDLRENPLAFDPERFIFYHNDEEIHPEDVDWNDEDLKPEEYRIVERPGEANSLGKVKFIMPNNFNIYLHDTPADQLFMENKRAFSHGCIRLEKPMDLASYLLRDNKKWTEEKMLEAMEKGEPVTAPLKRKYHVEIEYRTVWVDGDGVLNFREDIYGHDQRQIALLNRLEAATVSKD